MKIGCELEFQTQFSHKISGDFCTEYYPEMYEFNDMLYTGTPKECIDNLIKFIMDRFKAMPISSTHGFPYLVTSGSSDCTCDECEECDEPVPPLLVWNGLHIHIDAGESSTGVASGINDIVLEFLKDFGSVSERQRNSHHIWGGLYEGFYKYDYQKKSIYRPVAYRRGTGTYEIRILDVQNILMSPRRKLVKMFSDIHKIISTNDVELQPVSRVYRSDLLRLPLCSTRFMRGQKNQLAVYQEPLGSCYHVGWQLTSVPCPTKMYTITTKGLRSC